MSLKGGNDLKDLQHLFIYVFLYLNLIYFTRICRIPVRRPENHKQLLHCNCSVQNNKEPLNETLCSAGDDEERLLSFLSLRQTSGLFESRT